MRTRKSSKSAPVGVIGKVLRVLELLDLSPHGLQLSEIAAKTGMNKSTVHRFLSHLETEGYLFRDAVGTYMLGPKLARMGSGVSFQTTLCKICRPTLEKLRAATDETVNLALLDGLEILNLDVLESQNTFRLVFPVGARHSVHCTALGKAILANLEDGQRQEEILSATKFVSYTPKTITSIARLRKDLINIREQGFSLDDEEAMIGGRCIGAAIFDSAGMVVGAISISGPITRATRNRLPFFSAEVCKAAQEISSNLGYRPAKRERANNSRGTTRGTELNHLQPPKSRRSARQSAGQAVANKSLPAGSGKNGSAMTLGAELNHSQPPKSRRSARQSAGQAVANKSLPAGSGKNGSAI